MSAALAGMANVPAIALTKIADNKFLLDFSIVVSLLHGLTDQDWTAFEHPPKEDNPDKGTGGNPVFDQHPTVRW